MDFGLGRHMGRVLFKMKRRYWRELKELGTTRLRLTSDPRHGFCFLLEKVSLVLGLWSEALLVPPPLNISALFPLPEKRREYVHMYICTYNTRIGAGTERKPRLPFLLHFLFSIPTALDREMSPVRPDDTQRNIFVNDYLPYTP